MRGVTKFQVEVMQHVLGGNPEGPGLIDFDQLLARLSWSPTKAAAQFTIRALIGKGFLKKSGTQTRRGRNRVVFELTEAGKLVLDPRLHVPGKTTIVPELDFDSGDFKPDFV